MKVRGRIDRRKVAKAARKGSMQSLGKAGAYLRGIARRSIKKAPRLRGRDEQGRYTRAGGTIPSAPGKPPHTREGRLKDAILFGVEKARAAVVIGPTANAMGKIGHTHEFGGTEPPKKRKARKANWKLEVGGHGPIQVKGGKTVVVKLKTARQVERAKQAAKRLPPSERPVQSKKPRKYPRRPFMGPALVIGRPLLPKLWANSVRG